MARREAEQKLTSSPTPRLTIMNDTTPDQQELTSLTPNEREWIRQTGLKVAAVRAAEGQEVRWSCLDELEDHIVKRAMKNQTGADGGSPDNWIRLVSHLSRWSSKYPFQEVLDTVAGVVLMMKGSEQSGQQDDGCTGRDSPLPTPPLIPPMTMNPPSNMGRVERSVEERSTSKAAPEKRSPIPQQGVVLSRGTSSVPRPGAVMRTSTPQEEAPVVKSTVAVPNEAISSSLPANKTSGQCVSDGANRSAKLLPALPERHPHNSRDPYHISGGCERCDATLALTRGNAEPVKEVKDAPAKSRVAPTLPSPEKLGTARSAAPKAAIHSKGSTVAYAGNTSLSRCSASSDKIAPTVQSRSPPVHPDLQKKTHFDAHSPKMTH